MPSVELPIVRDVARLMERERFESPALVALASRLRDGEADASSRISALLRLVSLLNQRSNEVFALPSYAILWGTQFAMAIESWRNKHADKMRDWLAAMGDFEALVSLAAYAYEHPADPFPELLDSGSTLDATGLGHPLLNEETCVRNTVSLDTPGEFLIVSGSNMSGKSTFLRGIGLNVVLAWTGAPVRCRHLRVSPLRIGAAIRLQDSLIDGRSRFFAEMDRLRRMISIAGSTPPLLFLVDEIMSGTNSHDRRVAAEWVIRALTEEGSMGLITTHDLALTEIASTQDMRGHNVHFADASDGGGLQFDYQLRPGVVRNSNALNIVRMLGIKPKGPRSQDDQAVRNSG
jgi:DNA mismatch repair ATPase MutS